MKNKTMILKSNDGKSLSLLTSIKQYKLIQDEIKKLKDNEKILKEIFKKYDFEKVIILDEQGDDTIFQVTKYFQTRKELNIDKLIELIEAHVCGDLELTDMITHKQQFRDDLKAIIDSCYDEKKVECVKFTFK